MAFYYNDERLDTHDGEHGIIISRVAHDPSPAASVATATVPRADGVLVDEQSLREKRIRLEGTVIGSSKQDFEARLDALKHLLTARTGHLRITSYGTHTARLATFEMGEAWTGHGAWSTSAQRGIRSRTLTASSAGAVTTTWTSTVDVSTYASSTVGLSVLVPDAALLASVTVEFVTTAGTISRTWLSFTNGWNELTDTIGVNMGTINSITISALGIGAATDITFDDLRLITTADDRTYDVRLVGEIQIPREHYNATWCRFSAEFLCPLGTAQSSHWMKHTLFPTDRAQQFLPLDLGGAGTQSLQLHMEFGDTSPASIVVADHFVDRFAAYDTADIGSQYEVGPGDTWSVAAKGAYLTALTSGGTAGGAVSIRGMNVRNGSLTALLWRPGAGSVGVFARASDSADPLGGSKVRAALSHTGVTVATGITISRPSVTLEDDVLLNLGERAPLTGDWVWLRLIVRGRNATVEYRTIEEDTWTTAASGPTRDTSGAWGIWAVGTTAYCAHLELIDFDGDARGSLSVAIPPARAYPVRIDTAALAASTKGIVSGTFPRVRSGVQRGSVYMPASAIGSPLFHDAATDATDWMSIGGASEFKGAFIFNSGANTFIRRRGTFVYLARSYNATACGDLRAQLETVSGLDATGTLVSPLGFADIVEGTVKGRIDSSPAPTLDFNSSVVPYELVWGEDIPVTPNTDYAVVIELSPAGPRQTVWSTPTTSEGDAIVKMRQYDGAWANPDGGDFGFLILQGDNPIGSGTWALTAAHEPTYL